MKKTFGKAFVLGLVLMFCTTITMIGCSSTGTNLSSLTTNTIPTGCENSLIYKTIPNVKAVDAILQIANLEAIKYDAWKVEEAKGVVQAMLDLLNQENLTYSSFIQYAVANVKWLNENVATESVIVINYIDELNKPLPIDHCDIELLKTHLKHQQMVIVMSGKK